MPRLKLRSECGQLGQCGDRHYAIDLFLLLIAVDPYCVPAGSGACCDVGLQMIPDIDAITRRCSCLGTSLLKYCSIGLCAADFRRQNDRGKAICDAHADKL